MKEHESIENVKRCWICRRSEEEYLRDFKDIVLQDNEKSEVFGPIIPQDIKEIVKKDGILPYPEGLEWEHSPVIHFSSGWDLNNEKEVYFRTGHNMFVSIYLCGVCQSIFDIHWESLKEFISDRLKEKDIDIST